MAIAILQSKTTNLFVTKKIFFYNFIRYFCSSLNEDNMTEKRKRGRPAIENKDNKMVPLSISVPAKHREALRAVFNKLAQRSKVKEKV